MTLTVEQAEHQFSPDRTNPEYWVQLALVAESIAQEDDEENAIVHVRECEICGHPHVERHRIKPGRWGGTYDPWNVVHLCPNHHRAIHYLMRWQVNGCDVQSDRQQRRIDFFLSDPGLSALWRNCARPVVLSNLGASW
jgi:hypothetical protein